MPSEAANGSGPRYAPEDPTLPEPWKGLVDGNTGYLYYWNPVTNVTQYEKPVKEKLTGPPPLPKKSVVSSSVHREEQSYGEDGRSRSHKYDGGRPNGFLSLHGSGDSEHDHGNSIPGSRTSAKDHGPSDATGGLSSEAYRHQNEITIIGDDVPPPYMTFESTCFPADILKEVHRAGFTAPTPIQAQSWPIALQGRDVVAVAKTGSGKTLGYLIPGFIHLKRLHNNPRMGPTVLVLAPTRELATQIHVEADKFGRSSKIACTCVYGGAPKGPQLRDLDRGVDVVVATPGRLNDILEMSRVNLRQVSYLVLDEADRMLDMGFEPQIRKIVKEMPHRRQTLMFTATWPKEVRKIAADLLVHPVQVNIGSIDELVANKAITQYVEVIKPIEKQRRLEQILRSQEPGSKIIIFCSTKRMCDQLARTLARQFSVAAIHGDKNQSERDRVLGQFRTGRCPILVATDVAARGLDVKDIRAVVNFDFPTGVEDYVHRIGRTGRAGATGVSYTLFSDQDSKYALELVKVLEGAGQRVPSQLRDMVSRGGYGGKSRRWASGPRDLGRANVKGHGDSGYGARGGPGLPPSRSDGDRGVRRDSGDRYDRNHDYQNKLNGETRGRQDPKVIIPRGRVHSPSHGPGITLRADPKVRHDFKATSRVQVRSPSSSCSLSPSPKGARVGWGPKGSRSRSRSLDRPGRPMTLHGRSLVSKKREPLVDDGRSRDQSRRSPRSPVSYDDGEIRDDHQLDRSPHPRSGRSRSPIHSGDGRVIERSAHPRTERSGDERVDRAPHSRNERSLPLVQSREDRLDHSPHSRNERAPSPIQPREDRLERLPRPRMERLQSPCGDDGKRGGSLNGTERWSTDKAVRSRPLAAYDGDEEEEGMILPDEEEGMIHPDEDMISPKGK